MIQSNDGTEPKAIKPEVSTELQRTMVDDILAHPVIDDSDLPTPKINDTPEQPIVGDSDMSATVIDYADPLPPVEDDGATTSSEIDDQSAEEPTRKIQQVTQDYAIHSDAVTNDVDAIVFPSNFDKETRDVLTKMPNIKLLDDPDTRKWATDVSEGLELTTHNEAFVSSLEDESSDFRQRLEDNNISLMAGSPKFKSVQNETLKGERAVIRVISHLGMGTLFQVPLWHSGLWVTFKPPTESELIELNRILISDKIMFGRYTYGLVFSNTISYTTDRLIDFALAHVYDITAKSEAINVDNIKQHISCLDIPSLLWGFVCTMYPKGFKYRRACINDPEKCNYVLEETLNVIKLQWTNSNALNSWQKTFMAGRQSKTKDLEMINRYKDELRSAKHKRVVINEGLDNEVSIIIKTPNVVEYIEAGYRWVNDITEIVNRTMGLNAKDEERNTLVTRYGQASAMRQYVHWVDSVEYDTNIINDSETIETLLDALSSDDIIRSAFIKGVTEYINECTLSVIGIPVYDCPKCKQTQEAEHKLPAHTNIIPIDVIQLFFALLGIKMGSLTSR